MRVDGIRGGAGAGGPTVSPQDEYRYELLQRLRRRALDRRRAGDGARDRTVTGSAYEEAAAELATYEAAARLRQRPSGSQS